MYDMNVCVKYVQNPCQQMVLVLPGADQKCMMPWGVGDPHQGSHDNAVRVRVPARKVSKIRLMIQSLLSVGGLRDGSLFRAAPWVDRGKPPGATPQPQSWRSWLRGTLSLSFIVHSPNLVWLLIAAAVYVLSPYDVPGLTDSHAGCRKGKSRLNGGMRTMVFMKAGVPVSLFAVIPGKFHFAAALCTLPCDSFSYFFLLHTNLSLCALYIPPRNWPKLPAHCSGVPRRALVFLFPSTSSRQHLRRWCILRFLASLVVPLGLGTAEIPRGQVKGPS